MRVSPLNLVSTPVPVLNSLGLNLRIGLSSEDPMGGRNPSEHFVAYLSVYSPEGILLERRHLGDIPPERRRFFDISSTTRSLVPNQDHLVVVHRVPSKIAQSIANIEDEVELTSVPDYSMYRSLVEYSYPQGGNGSVIYETPPRLNAATEGHRSSNTFTFTCQTVVSSLVNSYAVLIHYSVNPNYAQISNYNFALYSLAGEQVVSDRVTVAPFSIKILDMSQIIPEAVIQRERDPRDGQSSFNFIGYSDDAAFIFLVVNAAPSLGAVALEHTHPSQAYLLPQDVGYQREIKASAISQWKSRLIPGKSENYG